jgi:uncharacterized coiled-coil protein SlyX
MAQRALIPALPTSVAHAREEDDKLREEIRAVSEQVKAVGEQVKAVNVAADLLVEVARSHQARIERLEQQESDPPSSDLFLCA